MDNILKQKILEVVNEIKTNRKRNENFVQYYAQYLTDNFYLSKMDPDELLAFVDHALSEISILPDEKQNEEIERLAERIKQELSKKRALKSEETFDGLRFIAITLLGRIKKSE